MSSLDIYQIKDQYISQLQKIEAKVMYNKADKKQRPYVGTVIKIDNYDYFVPLSSPKGNKKLNSEITITIAEDEEDTIGHMKFNNMIPVPKSEIKRINIKETWKTDPKYATLLEKEYMFIIKNEKRIIKKAENVYREKVMGNKKFFKKICINYKKLEKGCKEYTKNLQKKKMQMRQKNIER